MKEPITDRLVEMHHEVADLKVYDNKTAAALYKFCLEFKTLTTELIAIDEHKFSSMVHKFQTMTEEYCRLATQAKTEDERINAFYDGLELLNEQINHCLEVFA